MPPSTTREEILSTLKGAESLPTIPDVMVKLRRAVADPDAHTRDIVKIIENDPDRKSVV